MKAIERHYNNATGQIFAFLSDYLVDRIFKMRRDETVTS